MASILNDFPKADYTTIINLPGVPNPLGNDLLNLKNISQAIVVTSKAKNGDEIGNLTSQLINRDLVGLDFQKAMDGICHECSYLALSVVGRLFGQSALHESCGSGVLRGWGVWDAELNQGNFLVIQTTEVSEAYRRRGVGATMVRRLLRTVNNVEVRWVFTWPTRVPSDDVATPRHSMEEKDRAVAFWRKMGFRRIGTSDWFCYAMDPNHPSRYLAAEDDFSSGDELSSEGDSGNGTGIYQDVQSEPDRLLAPWSPEEEGVPGNGTGIYQDVQSEPDRLLAPWSPEEEGVPKDSHDQFGNSNLETGADMEDSDEGIFIMEL
ncbi:hypothetical protein NHQ30_010050 [Ciborinia camelliae]|nr:hypothetical protein NHQ30_010050 [Ciborinia camelliae]